MTDEERRAWAEAKARSGVMLDPVAARAAVAAETRRPHRDDNRLNDWDALAAQYGKSVHPAPEPAPAERRLTDFEAARLMAEVERIVGEHRAACAKGFKASVQAIVNEQKRVAALELRVDALAAEANKRRAVDEAERGEIIELPKFVSRRNGG